MRLYLTSYRIPTPDYLLSLIDHSKDIIKVAVIPNAKDYYADRARSFKLNETTDYLSNFGLQSDIVDLREYSDSQLLFEKLKNYDMIWAVGGNTFCLMSEMKRSGFDQIIKDVLSEGVVYGGESAGACVAGNSLKGLEAADEPAFAEDEVWDGLNLVPNFILPHVDNPMFAADIQAAREIHKDDKTVIELKDTEALIVDDDVQRIATKAA